MLLWCCCVLCVRVCGIVRLSVFVLLCMLCLNLYLYVYVILLLFEVVCYGFYVVLVCALVL